MGCCISRRKYKGLKKVNKAMKEELAELQALADKDNLTAMILAKGHYDKRIKFYRSLTVHVDPEVMGEAHLQARKEASNKFLYAKKFGGIKFSDKYHQQLMDEIDKEFCTLEQHNHHIGEGEKMRMEKLVEERARIEEGLKSAHDSYGEEVAQARAKLRDAEQGAEYEISVLGNLFD